MTVLPSNWPPPAGAKSFGCRHVFYYIQSHSFLESIVVDVKSHIGKRVPPCVGLFLGRKGRDGFQGSKHFQPSVYPGDTQLTVMAPLVTLSTILGVSLSLEMF